MKKFILTSFALGLFTLLSTSVVLACTNGKWPNPDPNKWSACVQTACGSNKGTQKQTLTCEKHNGSDECNPGTWIETTYTYTSGICPTNYHWQNEGNWNQRCHRNYNYMHPEHKAPIGCPTDYSPSDDGCRKVNVEGHQGTPADTKEVTRDCTVTEVVACDPTPEQETPTPTPTPTPESTATPTPTPEQSTPPNIGGPGDGLSDGRSDGRSSCPECTAPPKSTGEVLGATTDFAGTGTMENIIMNAIGILGGITTAVGIVLKKRQTK